jgi:hypothetical protein
MLALVFIKSPLCTEEALVVPALKLKQTSQLLIVFTDPLNPVKNSGNENFDTTYVTPDEIEKGMDESLDTTSVMSDETEEGVVENIDFYVGLLMNLVPSMENAWNQINNTEHVDPPGPMTIDSEVDTNRVSKSGSPHLAQQLNDSSTAREGIYSEPLEYEYLYGQLKDGKSFGDRQSAAYSLCLTLQDYPLSLVCLPDSARCQLLTLVSAGHWDMVCWKRSNRAQKSG